MPSAFERFPSARIEFRKRVTRGFPNTGSPGSSRLAMALFLGISSPGPPSRLAGRRSLLALGPVLRPALVATVDARRVERAAHDVIAHARQILHAAPADEHDRVLLQVVALARDVRRHLDAVGEAHARDLAQRRV